MAVPRPMKTSDLVDRVRTFLKPEVIVDDAARLGTEVLQRLQDPQLLFVFGHVCVYRKPIETAIEKIRTMLQLERDDTVTTNLTAALRRLVLVGSGLAKEVRERLKAKEQIAVEQGAELRGEDVSAIQQARAGVPPLFNKDSDTGVVWNDVIQRAGKSNPIAELEWLAEVQRRLVTQMLIESQGLNRIMAIQASKMLDRAIHRLQQLYDNIARLYLETGKLERAPHRVQASLEGGVAFFKALPVDSDAKNKALNATMRLIELIKSDAGVYEQKALADRTDDSDDS